MRCDRDQPGYYMDMLKAIAESEGVETKKIISYPSIESARKAKVKFYEMRLDIYGNRIMPIKVEMINNIKTLIFSTFQMPVVDYIGRVYVEVNKELKDYQSSPKYAGQYKHCEGGGWYSMANLYEFNDKIYTTAY